MLNYIFRSFIQDSEKFWNYKKCFNLGDSSSRKSQTNTEYKAWNRRRIDWIFCQDKNLPICHENPLSVQLSQSGIR